MSYYDLEPPKIQLNLMVKKNGKGDVVESSLMATVRAEEVSDALSMIKDLRQKLNGDLALPGQTPIDDDKEEDIVNHHERCARCGSQMVLRTAKQGTHRGESFYACSAYPQCSFIAIE